MPRKFVHGGLSYLTERPQLEQRFDTLTADLGTEQKLVGIAYDTRHTAPVTDNPIIWLAGDNNKKLYCCDSRTLALIESFDYPHVPLTTTPCTQCYGIAVINTPTDNYLLFLSEALQPEGYPVLYWLTYDATKSTPEERLSVSMYYHVSCGGNVTLNPDHRGMTEYMNDVMFLGMYQSTQTIVLMDKHGIPLAHYPAFTNSDDIRALMYSTQRVWTTMDGTSITDINERFLAKFLTDEVDKQRMIPIIGLEPFFFDDYQGDIALYQDRMAATHKGIVYLYRMIYYAFIVDSVPNDDIDMGSVLIGDYKIKSITFKNIADYYRIKDVTITKLAVTCPGAASACPAKEAPTWVKFSSTDPFGSPDPTTHAGWGDTLALATTPPYISPDGEMPFWVKIAVPSTYATMPGRDVVVDDGPFIVPIEVTVKVG